MGQVPKKKATSAQAWMQGKILTALLIERLLCEARLFFPVGIPVCATSSQWGLFKEFRDAVLVQLAMPLALTEIAGRLRATPRRFSWKIAHAVRGKWNACCRAIKH